MHTFRTDDPFPLLDQNFRYEEEKIHSESVDQWLGFQFERSENFLPPKQAETWKSKGVQVFLTPYSELRRILAELDPKRGQTIVDLGAGYGRLGFVMARHYPHTEFQGFEIVRERVEEANRVSALWKQSFRLVEADISQEDFPMPLADTYFIYDFGHRDQMQTVLEKLRAIARKRSIRLVGRGGRIRDLVGKNHPWLWAIQPPRHFANFSIYGSGEIS